MRTFARVRELVAVDRLSLELAAGARAADVWQLLIARAPGLQALLGSTRIARNGRVVDAQELLAEGDEIALLPPTGGG